MAFVSRRCGDVEPHACLLCSLLLGFGLDAYVVLGERVGETRPHAWVLTRGGAGGGVTFWESLTGQTFAHAPTRLGDLQQQQQQQQQKQQQQHRFARVGCAFNHNSFFANIQPLDDVGLCAFDFLVSLSIVVSLSICSIPCHSKDSAQSVRVVIVLVIQDESRWKCLSPEVIRSVCPSGSGGVTGSGSEGGGGSSWELAARIPPLVPPNLDASILANDLELELKTLIAGERERGMRIISSHPISSHLIRSVELISCIFRPRQSTAVIWVS